jgi:soluble lytic murein transglycosylase-like protein
MQRKLLIAAVLTVLASSARAAEHVTLLNGSEMLCNHHTEIDGRVRLYLSAGEENYIEFAPQELSRIEPTPDPPTPRDVAQNPAKGPTAVSPDARLSQVDLGEILARASHEHNLDVDLLASVVKAESGGNARARSHAGAQGLMQLMPGTASDLGVEDSFKPDQNVRGGSTYLDELLVRYRDNLALALAAYNAGPAAVDKYRGIPPYRETQAYVARVIHEFNRRVRAREALARNAVASVSTP